jgi:hypothetical protein
MQVTIFDGSMKEVERRFNEWAKGKALTREVIIQSHLSTYIDHPEAVYMTILVFHPNDDHWNKTADKPIQPIQPEIPRSTGMEREANLT